MKIIVMLIWMGALNHGGPAIIQGFSTLAACEAARPVVEQRKNDVSWSSTYTTCIELERGS